ncbi:hypothetical protein CMO88_02600 [Candidatus Woesearchaeota archaeon]|nr:hypothetical protein [Candidatus Woesearchaeota archaeon]|tara:strand:- start:4334 stop:5224 length:891 start_codon:yes stop_codon:yes gene_type:complete
MAILANIAKNRKLVSRKNWEKYIGNLRTAATSYNPDKKQIKEELQQKLIEAVNKRLPNKKFGIMLSGGVDSSTISLIAKKLHGTFICYSVGMEGSKDVTEAKKVAKKLKLKLRYKLYSLKEAEKIIKKAVIVVGEPNVVNVGVAAVELAAIQLAKKDKINTFFGGLGSEEIFAGYQRHENAKDVNKECWNGLKNMWARDLSRDFKVATITKANFLVPFLDKDLIIAAMNVPGKYKISKDEKKIILREVAMKIGLPKQFAFRKKLAAQYGSGFDKAIEKLSKQNRFKYKKEYLKSLQ